MSRQASGTAKRPPTPPKPIEQHAEWLNLLRPDGPFISLPVLTAAFPQGLDSINQTVLDRLRQAWAEVRADPGPLHHAWQRLVCTELLGWSPQLLREGGALPAGLPDDRPPDAVLVGPDRPVAGQSPLLVERVLVYRRPWDESLAKASRQATSLVERAAETCRRRGVPLALVTNGQQWTLVHARPDAPTTVATFDADLWLEERLLLRAFASLLTARRIAVAPVNADGTPSDSLAALFIRTEQDRAEVTTTLGAQVRRAVELLVAELSRLDRESGHTLLTGLGPRTVYRAALTVMMRLVFLLYAEEQRLLPVDDEVYAQGYAVGALHEKLLAERDRFGPEIGDRREAAWPRLLAVFSAVFGGVRHPDLRVPAYGGSLFDPARYPFLTTPAVTDRVVFEILDALLTLRQRGKVGQRLSYKGLEVEQIGHVYEGLLEFSCLAVDEPYLGLFGKHEPELTLAQLEGWAAEGTLAERLTTATGATARQVAGALAATPSADQLAALHAACDNDASLAERIVPFFGALRVDLRGLPTVFPAGSIVLTQVGDRRATGTHYTPRALAAEIVEHTLAPLCYTPWPPPQPDEDSSSWRVRTESELLALKVLDPAMGSGAFLVSACDYLAQRVVEAWARDGLPMDVASYADDADRDELLLYARRLVADRCLYGVDRDPMAVELAKLSLWLVTLARGRPFSFLDHALRCGDSLIGTLTSDQVAAFHLDPERGRLLNLRLSGTIDERTGPLLEQAAGLRRDIEAMPVLDVRDAQDKARTLRTAEELTDRLRLAADAVVGAALSVHAPGALSDRDVEDYADEGPSFGKARFARTARARALARDDAYDERLTAISELVEKALDGDVDAAASARATVDGWLRGPATGPRTEPIRPLHWPLEFPELVDSSGPHFDAVVGNPPFIGGKKVSGTQGVDYREYLKLHIADDAPGNADLCSYFLLRVLSLAPGRRAGLITTNTIAQGDTREVGLDQAYVSGWKVYRAIKSQPWPGTASLEVSLVWLGHPTPDEPSILDGQVAKAITPALDPQSRVIGKPHRLAANQDMSFIGCYVLGAGFILEADEAQAWIDADLRNEDVLFPYLNGEDLNSRPDCSARRWVIDFNDWPIERAREYTDVFAIIEKNVRPERQRKKPDGSYVLRKPLPERWWQYADKRPALRRAIAGLDRVLVIALTSKTALPVMVSNGQVFSHALGIFGTSRSAHLALLSSSAHYWWTITRASDLRGDLRYTPSDCFETFAQPRLTGRMEAAGEALDTYRAPLMLRRELGLTKLYNLAHDSTVADADIARLREIHVEIDQAVAEAYGWDDLDLGHGFHPTAQGERFTIAPPARTEILDRLLELNHQRYAEEVAAGLHAGKPKRKPKPPPPPPTSTEQGFPDDTLF